MIRRTLALGALLGLAAAPVAVAAARPASAHPTRPSTAVMVRQAVEQVELAAVRDDDAACVMMGPSVQRAVIAGAGVTSGAAAAPRTCLNAVRDDYAGYLRNDELGSESRAQEALARAFADATVTLSDHARSALVSAHLITARFLGAESTTVSARLQRDGATWTVMSLSQRPGASIGPPPPIP